MNEELKSDNYKLGYYPEEEIEFKPSVSGSKWCVIELFYSFANLFNNLN